MKSRMMALILVSLVYGLAHDALAFYSPSTGRWLSRDPIGERGGLNVYGFVDNNSILYVDVTGTEKFRALQIICASANAAIPGQPQKTKLSLKPKLQRPARRGFCGDISWEIAWEIENAILNRLGGHVVQNITISWDIEDNFGNKISSSSLDSDKIKSPLTYWEAWLVNARASSPNLTVDGKWDVFSWGDEGRCTKGKVKWDASASFYHGLNPLPSSMVPNNKSTLAHDLPSTTVDPTGSSEFSKATPTDSVAHSLEIEWDCRKTRKRTEIKSHIPQ